MLALQQEGARLLDVRDPNDFEGAHLVGSTNIALDGRYATWAGTLLDSDTAIVLVANPGTEKEATTRLGRIGFDQVAGFLRDGMQALDARPELFAQTLRITAAALDEQFGAAPAPFLLDVRSENEWREKRIPDSCNIPLNHLTERLDEVPRDRPLVVYCAGGYRSAIAASLLEWHQFEDVTDLVGGIGAWEAAQLKVASS